MKAENVDCLTVRREVGTCIHLESCAELFEISTASPLSSRSYAILLRSKCSVKNSKDFYCCSKIEEKQNVTSLQGVTRVGVPATLPGAPTCGSDFQDRIIGGNITQIDEFPWTALLFYKLEGKSN